MAKETCTSCEWRLSGAPHFCGRCGSPTSRATQEEILDWDLKKWRAHVDRSVSADASNGGHAKGAAEGPIRLYSPALATLKPLDEFPTAPVMAPEPIVPSRPPSETVQSLPAKLPSGDLASFPPAPSSNSRRRRLAFS